MRTVTLAFAVALSGAALPAFAQESAPMPPTDDAPPSAATAARPASATVAAQLATGAKVSDAAGGEIGTIEAVSETETGTRVDVNIDGDTYALPASTFSTASGTIVSRMTKDQIKAAATPPQPK